MKPSAGICIPSQSFKQGYTRVCCTCMRIRTFFETAPSLLNILWQNGCWHLDKLFLQANHHRLAQSWTIHSRTVTCLLHSFVLSHLQVSVTPSFLVRKACHRKRKEGGGGGGGRVERLADHYTLQGELFCHISYQHKWCFQFHRLFIRSGWQVLIRQMYHCHQDAS